MACHRVDDGNDGGKRVALAPQLQRVLSGLQCLERNEALAVGGHLSFRAVVELPADLALHLVALCVAEQAVDGKQRVAEVAPCIIPIDIVDVAGEKGFLVAVAQVYIRLALLAVRRSDGVNLFKIVANMFVGCFWQGNVSRKHAIAVGEEGGVANGLHPGSGHGSTAEQISPPPHGHRVAGHIVGRRGAEPYLQAA